MSAPNPVLSPRTHGHSGSTGIILAVACLCQLMVVLDVSVVNLALPSIQADLGFDRADLQWVINAYTLTFGGLLLLGGRLADLFGHRRAALVGMGMFGVTSLLGGLAQSPAELVAARALQGVAGAVLLPVSLTLITAVFPEGPPRHRALAVWGGVAEAGGAVGLFVGGAFTDLVDWRWVLFINVPIAIVAMMLTARVIGGKNAIGTGVERRRPGLDIPGALLASAGLFSLVYAVVGTDRHPWLSAHTVVPIGIAVVLLGAFVMVERHTAEPLVRFGLLRSRSLVAANVVIFVVSSAQLGAFYFASLYLQGVFGYSALRTGVAFLPFSAAIIAGTMSASRLIPRLGARLPLVAGLLLGAAGMAWFARLDPHGTFLTQVLGPSILAGTGMGLCFVCVANAATSGVAYQEAGLASGLVNSSRQIGGAVGLAVLVTVANAADDQTIGTDRIFVVAALFMAAGALVAAVMMRQSDVRT